VSDLTVAGLDEDLQATTVPLAVSSLTVHERYYVASELEVTVADSSGQLAGLLPKFDFRTGEVVNPDGATFVKVGSRPFLPWKVTRSTDGRKVTVRGPCVGGMFDTRSVVPPGGASHQVATGTTTERMRAYVHAQAAAGAPVADRIPHLTAPVAAPAGPSGRSEERYSVLAELLVRLGEQGGIGWDVRLDAGGIIWFPIVGVQRPEVVLSLERQTASSITWDRDVRQQVTTAIVAGQGELEDRTIVVRGDDRAGLFRRVAFVDARDTDDVDTLEARGDEVIAENTTPDLLDVRTLQSGPERYGAEFHLGDVVTVQQRQWGLTVQARVVEAVTTVDGGSPVQVELGLGRPLPTLRPVNPTSPPPSFRT
jgi:hypothetical protein